MEALEEKSVEKFEEVLREYDKVTPFDKLKTKVLVKVKDQFKSEAERLESDGFA